MDKRSSGILLHLTSLPSRCGIGDLGPAAYAFADFLAQTKQSFWQILPLNPTDMISSNSPYSSLSSYAGNPLLISPELLVRDALLIEAELEPLLNLPLDRVDFKSVIAAKEQLADLAYDRFKNFAEKDEYEKFCIEQESWLEDFALFKALKTNLPGHLWANWPTPLRDRHPAVIQNMRGMLHDKIGKEKFLQYLFFKQWLELKNYCQDLGIQFLGDIPIYLDYDSADVWTNPEIFKLDHEKKPIFMAGVPPDYFSKTGQLWKNPVYQWEGLKNTKFSWWLKRIEHNLKLFDWIRIDHFRGLVAYWEVPASEKTAVKGKWIPAPAEDFLNTLKKYFYRLPLIAEDLGVITDEVKEIMQRFDLPGMKILLFAFGEDNPTHPYLPHNYTPNCVVYTGTHDNNTIRGWFENEAKPEEKRRLFAYLGREVLAEEVNWELIKLGMHSPANLMIAPLQDILGLGEEARMNQPGTTKGNWEWRLLLEQLTDEIRSKLLELTKISDRA